MERLIILPGDRLFRRLHPDTVDYVKKEVKRNAFYVHGKPHDRVSVHVERVYLSPAEALAREGKSDWGMGVLIVSEVEDLGFKVEPEDSPEDPAHAVITGVLEKPHCDMLRGITDIFIWPVRPRPASATPSQPPAP